MAPSTSLRGWRVRAITWPGSWLIIPTPFGNGGIYGEHDHNHTTTPAVTTSKSSYAAGENIGVNYSSASGSAKDWIGLFAAGAPNSAYLTWTYSDNTKIGTAGLINGTVNFSSGLTSPGNYEVRLFFNNGSTPAAVVAFTVLSSATALTTSKTTYARGENIAINFANASGSAKDWIGIYPAGAVNSSYLLWAYTDNTKTGTAGLINGTVNFPSGLSTSGNYEARLFFNNSSTSSASVTFKVQ